MRKFWIAGALGVAVVSAGVAPAQIGERWRERRAHRMEQQAVQGRIPGAQTIAYGKDPLQVLDVWLPKASKAISMTGKYKDSRSQALRNSGITKRFPPANGRIGRWPPTANHKTLARRRRHRPFG